MNLHEFQAKQLFALYGIAVPVGFDADSAEAARAAASRIGGDEWVVKAQVHAGGRGKAGGIKRAKSLDDVESAAVALLGTRLVTHQTPPEGLPVRHVLIAPVSQVARELYLGAVIARARERVVFMASSMGGMDIEPVAETQPEQILAVTVDPVVGLQQYQVRQVGFALKLDMKQFAALSAVMDGLYRLFMEKDASLVEINPLVITDKGELLAVDAKVNLDDNALFRHADLLALKDESQENAMELEAQKHGLNYVPLDGSIACMDNGAGLA